MEIQIILPLREDTKGDNSLTGDELLKARMKSSQGRKQAYAEQKRRADEKNTKKVDKSLISEEKRRARMTAIEKYESTRQFRSVEAVNSRQIKNNANRERMEINGNLKIVYKTRSRRNKIKK